MFYGSPGLRLLSTIGTGPIRAAHTASGFGWVVSGNSLYQVTSAGVATLIGVVPGTGRVCLVHNDTQLAVMHSAGWHVLTFSTLGYGAVSGAPTTAQGTYQDSYIIFPNTDGTYGWTNIGDAQSLDALNFASSEANPDPIIAVLSDHRELWLFNTQTVEIAQTSGDADLVFVRTAIMEYGCAAKYSPAKSDSTVFWLSQNDSGKGMVYMAEGYSPARISTHALENAIAGYGDISTAWGYCYQQNGHTFYVITFPGYATWSFDASAKRWTQLAYRNPDSGAQEQHRGNAYMFLGSSHMLGDYANGNLYALDLDAYTDNGNEIYRERAWAVIEDENKWLRHNRLEIMAEMGVGLDGITPPIPGADPLWLLDWSDDGCRNFSNSRELHIGQIGAYRNRGVARRLGLSRRRVYRIRTTDPVKIAVYGANLDATASSK